ncbi:MAG: segregation/condensation protein A [Chthonomonadales bacterium]|nr:segregation/condensation protein A [Chthonomonadales bacterium]
MALTASPLQFRLPVFEGPLDLLLHLIRKQRIDIYDIPIALIAEQYLQQLAMWEALDLAVAGEYVVMAATLIELKSRLLLPAPTAAADEEEVDPRAELVERLLEYERYSGVVDVLRGREEARRGLFFRGALENAEDYTLSLAEGEADSGALLAALRRLLAEVQVDDATLTAVVPRRRISLRMKMAEMMRRLRGRERGMDFDSLLERPLRRQDIVLTFLALLELLRLGRVRAETPAADQIRILAVEPAG